MRIELMHTGATNQRVNHFTNDAISKYKLILANNKHFDKFFLKKIQNIGIYPYSYLSME